MTYEELLSKNEELRNLAVFQDNCNENVFKQLSENINDVFWLRNDKGMIYIEDLFEEEIEGNYDLIHAKNGQEAVEICTVNNNIDHV